jgi:LacI family transcriptional regulator
MNLKELSQKFNLSPTTPSRALNGYPEGNAVTRERVSAAAKRFNYRPNQRAISLATGRANAVGHVITNHLQNEMMNPIFSDFIAGASEAYLRADFDMILSVVSYAEEEAAYRLMKSKGNVAGVSVQSVRHDDPRIAFLTEIGMPFITHGRATGVDPLSDCDARRRNPT